MYVCENATEGKVKRESERVGEKDNVGKRQKRELKTYVKRDRKMKRERELNVVKKGECLRNVILSFVYFSF